MTDDQIVILTALNLEYDAVRSRLTNPRPHRTVRGTRFEIGAIPGRAGQIVLGQVGKGGQAAAVLAERAIQEFAPVAVLFVGVAGALWDTTALGDVVMATHVYAYHGGTSEDDGLKARPRAWEAPHWISQTALHLSRFGDWADPALAGGHAPRVHFGPIAAGEIVQNSRVSREALWIREHYNDAMAIEMEGAGVAQAGHLNDSPVAVIRGISDRADGKKASVSDRDWQPRAAANAAAFAVRLASELITDRKATVSVASVERDRTVSETGKVINVASGSVVGAQSGQITGSTVTVSAKAPTPPSAGLAAELAAFADLLIRERADGGLDEVTYRAAKAELDSARDALPADTPERRNVLILALKRLRGLIADVTDLATRIANLLVTAKELR